MTANLTSAQSHNVHSGLVWEEHYRAGLPDHRAVNPAGLVTDSAIGALKNDCLDPGGTSSGWAPGRVIGWLAPFP